MSLVTLEEVKDYLEITSTGHDGRLANIINYASKAVETYCGREFAANTYTEYHDGGTPSIFLERIPVNNVTVVAEYDGTNYANLNGPNSDGSLPANVGLTSNALQYMYYEDTGEIRKLKNGRATMSIDLGQYERFNNYAKGVKVTYGAGYVNIPNDLKLAILDYIKLLHKNESGSETFSFQGESKSSFPTSANFPAHIRRILELYRILM